MRILIVEDVKETRYLLRVLLRGLGELDEASTGIEALAAIRKALVTEKPYDLICLDIMMPEMYGSELLQKVREMEETAQLDPASRPAILIITALPDTDPLLEGLPTDRVRHLLKPFMREDLHAALDDLGIPMPGKPRVGA